LQQKMTILEKEAGDDGTNNSNSARRNADLA
jgi:hypothetical protein